MYDTVQLWSYSAHMMRCKAIADDRTGFSLEALKWTFSSHPRDVHPSSPCVMGYRPAVQSLLPGGPLFGVQA